MTNWSETVLAGFDSVELAADVLVIGGGPAGTWAALAAAAEGASVVLTDKGYCGTSGATAPSGVGVWYVPPDPEAREQARASREALGGYLSERRWMDRVLDTTYANVDRARALLDYAPTTRPDVGIQRYWDWLQRTPR